MMNYEKKIRRKIITIVVIISIFAPIFTLKALAVSTKFNLETKTTEVARGETFTIAVKTENIDDIKGGFNGYSGTLEYDTSRFSRSKTETSVSGWNFVYNPSANTFLGSDPTGMDFKTSNLEVFSITFEVLSNAPLGETSIDLNKIAVSDSNYRNINLSNSNIKINIVDTKDENPKSSNNKLSSLEVEGHNITPKFDPGKTQYELKVKNDVKDINIKAILEDSKASIISGSGKQSLKEGKNTIVVTVKAEDGSSKNYTIVIERATKDNDGNGNDGSGNNNGSGNGDDNNGTGNGDGSGNNNNNSGNGSTGTPGNQNNNSNGDVNVNVDTDSSNNFVIDIQGLGNLDKEFSKDVYHYITYVGRDITKLEPIITLEDMNASYKIIGGSDLKIGKNEVILEITASNGEVREYLFDVMRTEEDNNTLLSDLSVGGYAINPGFREDVNYYTLNVDSNVSSLGVSASPKYGGSQINIVGHDKINYGANYIKVSVTGNQKMNTYIVEVIRAQEPPKLNLLPWIISGILGVLVIVLLLVLYFNKKIKDTELKNMQYAHRMPYPQYDNQYFYQNVQENGQTVRKKYKVVEETEI